MILATALLVGVGAAVLHARPTRGSCHALGFGAWSRPDPRCTPGAPNPQVTQATLGRTICRRGWTSRIRPPASVTEPEKAASMNAYGDHGSMRYYEYDHFIPLELGGAANDRRNLWPEPGASPNQKDAVENELRREVCAGRMTLRRARRLITTDWTSVAPHNRAWWCDQPRNPGSIAPRRAVGLALASLIVQHRGVGDPDDRALR